MSPALNLDEDFVDKEGIAVTLVPTPLGPTLNVRFTR
jgi:hypothetical protein